MSIENNFYEYRNTLIALCKMMQYNTSKKGGEAKCQYIFQSHSYTKK